MMREDLLNELEAEYAARRASNERIGIARRRKVHDEYPAIEQLILQRQDILRAGIRELAGAQKAGAPVEKPSLSEQVDTLNMKIREGLKKAGLPEEYLDPVYSCTLCHDTGYTGDLIREPCRCLTEAYQKKLPEKIGMAGGQAETFESFDLDMIPDEKENGQKYSQRDMSRVARDWCEKWAEKYPGNSRHTIVLTGKSGLGKTYLMHAMARRLADRGYSALTISAFQYLQIARKSYFENDGGLDELIEAPVLMLDDAGSEPMMKNITVETLFNLINERQNRGLATVISTNLTMEEFRERYTERICSRITDPRNSMVITLEGKDLRKVRAGQK